MKILLLEDFQPIALAFKALITAQGHDVVWLQSVESLNPFRGVDGSGSQVTLELSQFQLALVDGQFDKSPIQKGEEVAAQLLAQGVKVLGISSQNGPNQEMVRLGAVAAVNKAIAFVALVCELIAIDDIVNGGIDAAARWQECEAEVRARADLRRKADDYFRSF